MSQPMRQRYYAMYLSHLNHCLHVSDNCSYITMYQLFKCKLVEVAVQNLCGSTSIHSCSPQACTCKCTSHLLLCATHLFPFLAPDGYISICSVQTDYHGKTMHPSVREYLKAYFRRSNNALYDLLKRDFQWADMEQ